MTELSDLLASSLGGSLEAVTLTAPKPVSGYMGKAGDKVVLDPLSGNYFPAKLGTPKMTVAQWSLSGSNQFWGQRGNEFTILTDDGNLFVFIEGSNSGNVTTTATLARWRYLPDQERFDYMGGDTIRYDQGGNWSQRYIRHLTRIDENTWVVMSWSRATSSNYKLHVLTYDPASKDFTVRSPSSSVRGTATTQAGYQASASIVPQDDGTALVVFARSPAANQVVVDVWDLSNLTLVQDNITTSFTNSGIALNQHMADSSRYTTVAPLTDGNFLTLNGNAPALAQWTGSALITVGTVSETGNFFTFGPILKMAEDVYANVRIDNNQVLMNVVRYDPATSTLTRILQQSEAVTVGNQQGYGSRSSIVDVIGDKIVFQDSNGSWAVIDFDPTTFELKTETLREVNDDAYQGINYFVEDNGLIHGSFIADYQSSDDNQRPFVSAGLGLLGNMIDRYAPIPIGALISDDTPTSSTVWITVPTVKGEELSVGAIYGDLIAVSDTHAVRLRSAGTLIHRIRDLDSEEARLGSIRFRTDYARIRGGTIEAFHGETLRVRFGVSGLSSSGSSLDQVIHAEGLIVSFNGNLTLNNTNVRDAKEITDINVFSIHAVTARSGGNHGNDVHVFTEVEVD